MAFTSPFPALLGRLLALLASLTCAWSSAASAAETAPANCPPLLQKSFNRLQDDAPQNLCQYAGKVLLVVNTASKCGYTPQYEGLEALQKQYASKGFAVLGFPSNDFKGQEPGDEKQIQDFCTLTYGVKFPMFEKVHVTGAQATPLYQRLTAATGVAPAWNFHKYLVGRDGRVIAQYASKVTPDDPQLKAAIDKALAAPAVH